MFILWLTTLKSQSGQGGVGRVLGREAPLCLLVYLHSGHVGATKHLEHPGEKEEALIL